MPVVVGSRIVGAGGGGGGGDLPAGTGPYVASGGSWVLLHASDIPADGDAPSDTDVQTYLDALDTSVGTLTADLAGKVDASGGTLTDGTLEGTTTVSTLVAALGGMTIDGGSQGLALAAANPGGTITIAAAGVTTTADNITAVLTGVYAVQGASQVDLTGSARVDVPTPAPGDDSSQAASTEFLGALREVAYTRTTAPAAAIGSSPSWVTILTLTIAPGESRILDGYVLLTGGTAAAPTRGVIALGGSSSIAASRGSGGGAPTVTGSPAVVGGTIPALAAQVTVVGNDVVLQARATSGPSVARTFFYRWDLDTP